MKYDTSSISVSTAARRFTHIYIYIYISPAGGRPRAQGGAPAGPRGGARASGGTDEEPRQQLQLLWALCRAGVVLFEE